MISRIFHFVSIKPFVKINQKRKASLSSESDDDIPLASLREKMKPSTKKRKKIVKKQKPAPKPRGKARSAPVKKTVSASPGDSYDTVNHVICMCTRFPLSVDVITPYLIRSSVVQALVPSST